MVGGNFRERSEATPKVARETKSSALRVKFFYKSFIPNDLYIIKSRHNIHFIMRISTVEGRSFQARMINLAYLVQSGVRAS